MALMTQEEFERYLSRMLDPESIEKYGRVFYDLVLREAFFAKFNPISARIVVESFNAALAKTTHTSSNFNLTFLAAFNAYFIKNDDELALAFLNSSNIESHEPCHMLKLLINKNFTQIINNINIMGGSNIAADLSLIYLAFKEGDLNSSQEFTTIFQNHPEIDLNHHIEYYDKKSVQFPIEQEIKFDRIYSKTSFNFQVANALEIKSITPQTHPLLKEFYFYCLQKVLLKNDFPKRQELKEININNVKACLTTYLKCPSSYPLEILVLPKELYSDLDFKYDFENMHSFNLPDVIELRDLDLNPIELFKTQLDFNKKRKAYINEAKKFLQKIDAKTISDNDIEPFLNNTDFFAKLMGFRNTCLTEYFLGFDVLKAIIQYSHSEKVNELLLYLTNKNLIHRDHLANIQLSIVEILICQMAICEKDPIEKKQTGIIAIAHGLIAYHLYESLKLISKHLIKVYTQNQEQLTRLFIQVFSSLCDKPFAYDSLESATEALLSHIPLFKYELMNALDYINAKIYTPNSEKLKIENIPFIDLLHSEGRQQFINESVVSQQEKIEFQEKKITSLENDIVDLKKEMMSLKEMLTLKTSSDEVSSSQKRKRDDRSADGEAKKERNTTDFFSTAFKK